MTFQPTPPEVLTAFAAFYQNLSDADKNRFRQLVCWCCCVSERTFYRYLDHPEWIDKANRYHIALLANVDPAELFKTV